MKIWRTTVLLVAAALVLCALPAAAQTNLSGSLYAGYAKWLEDGAPGGSIGFRGNLFYMVHPVIGVGVEGGYHMLGKIEDVSFKAIQATGQVMARGVVGNIRPFGTGGAGLYNLRFSEGGETFSDSKFGFNLGGGVQFKPSPGPVSFGVEARWHDVLTEGSSTNLLTVMGGVNF
jgi:opacity protein-like surface antigen